jgi:hypothetical protein
MNYKEIIKQYPQWILLAGLTILLMAISLLSPGYEHGADNVNHYFLSRYSFIHPEKFLNPWGRPLYTILSSPFAQFGFQGIKLFNVFLGLLTSYFAFLLVKRLKMSLSWLVIIFVIFMPEYFMMLFTALTEVLCGFVLVLAVWLFFEKRYIASAIVISFIPFARAESFIFFPLFILAFILMRKYKAIIFLFTGFLFFCIVGTYQYNDFFWPITQFPYALKVQVQAYLHKGDFWEFFNARIGIWGLFLEVMLLFGIFAMIYPLFDKKNESKIESISEILLVLSPVVLYFFFHSYVYWKSLGGSLGLIRVIAAILPLSAVICMRGFLFIFERLPGKSVGKMIFLTAAILFIIYTNFTTHKYPVPLGEEEVVLKKAADWLKKSPYSKHFLYYTDSNIPFFLDLDPYDPRFSSKKYLPTNLSYLPDSSILFWEAHFGSNECELPFDSIIINPGFKLLKFAKPDVPKTTFGGYLYEADVFLKLPPGHFSNYESVREFLENDELNLLENWKFDFEKQNTKINLTGNPNDTAYSGTYSLQFDSSVEFGGPGFLCKLADLPLKKGIFLIKCSIFLKTQENFPDRAELAPRLVISLEDTHGSYFYDAMYFTKPLVKPGQWQQVKYSATIEEVKSKEEYLKVYIWNPGKQKFLADDLSISVYQPK